MRKSSLAAASCIATTPSWHKSLTRWHRMPISTAIPWRKPTSSSMERRSRPPPPPAKPLPEHSSPGGRYRTPGHQQRYPAPARLAGSQCGAGDRQYAGYGQWPLLDPAPPGHGPLHHLDERLTHPRHQGGSLHRSVFYCRIRAGSTARQIRCRAGISLIYSQTLTAFSIKEIA